MSINAYDPAWISVAVRLMSYVPVPPAETIVSADRGRRFAEDRHRPLGECGSLGPIGHTSTAWPS